MIIQPKKFFSNGTFNSGNTTFSAVAPSAPFTSPADLSPLAWFRLSTGAYQADGTTPAVSGDTMRYLRAEGDAAKYYDQTDSANRPVLATTGGKLSWSGLSSAVARYVRMAGTSTLITLLPQFSLSMWIYAPSTTTSSARPIFGESNINSTIPNLGAIRWDNGTSGATAIRFRITPNTSGGDVVTKTLNGTWFNNAWHHFVWTDNNGVVVYYLDGTAYSEFSYTRQVVTIPNQGVMVVPKTVPGSFNMGFTGFIGDNLVLDNKIWTQTDVNNLYSFG
jgi:hypothetical protein